MANVTPPASPTPPQQKTCPDCDARGPLNARFCWLCGRPLEAATAGSEGLSVHPERPAASQNVLALVFAGLVICVIVLGVYQISAPMAYLLGLLALPAYLAVVSSIQSQRSRNAPSSPRVGDVTQQPVPKTAAPAGAGGAGTFIATVLISLAAGGLIVFVIILSVLSALFSICMGGIN